MQNSQHPLKGNLLYAIERVLKLSVPNLYVWLCMFYCIFHLWYVPLLLIHIYCFSFCSMPEFLFLQEMCAVKSFRTRTINIVEVSVSADSPFPIEICSIQLWCFVRNCWSVDHLLKFEFLNMISAYYQAGKEVSDGTPIEPP